MKVDPDQFFVEQKEVISKIRVPEVQEVSAFDDALSGGLFRQAEDPYEGKSFAEVLRMKREKLEAQLKAAAPSEPAAQAEPEVQPEPKPTGADESLEDRKARLQAQRAAILEKRRKAREQELNEYNQSQSGAHLDAARNSFYAQMIKMDQALPRAQQKNPLPDPSTLPSAKPLAAASQPSSSVPSGPPAQAAAAFSLDDIEGININ